MVTKKERLNRWFEILESCYTTAQRDVKKKNLDPEQSLLFSVQIHVIEGKEGFANEYANTGFNDGCKVKEFIEE